MIQCPDCNTEIVPGAKFCHSCGRSLDDFKHSVSSAGADRMNHNRSITLEGKKHHAERRIVTILFSDVKGSTALAENLDPEEVLEIMNRAFKIFIGPVVKYEGKVARLMGDAILAFFGAPVSHEDDADRACRAALEIIEGAKVFAEMLKRENGIDGFNVRVGINTGLVVVGEVGVDSNVEYTAMGDAVNVAARMESSAEPGTVLITEETKKYLHSDFMFQDLGEINVKGKREPVKTFRLLGRPEKVSTGKTSKLYDRPIIARQAELETIGTVFEELRVKKGGVISIYGDNGVGKTRLLQESRKLVPPGINWIEGKAEAYTTNNSYWMARTILRNYFGFHPDEPSVEMWEKIKNRLEKTDEVSGETIGFLSHFLNIKAEDQKISGILKQSPDTFKGRLHLAITEFLTREITNRPTIMVWDNLHWCDSSSREMLREIISLSKEIPLLLILVYRLDESQKAVWDFHYSHIELPGTTHKQIRLDALNPEETHQLIKLLLKTENVPPDLMDRIYERTQGNALFVEEVLNSFLEKGVIRLKNNKLETGDFNKEVLVPDLLHNVLLSRIDSLRHDEKRVLQTASVAGRVFQEKLLVHLFKDDIGTDQLKSILKKLQQKELILRHLSSGFDNRMLREREYIFKHPLMQEVVYSTLLLSHRQQLHQQTGDAIVALNGEDLTDYISSLGMHYEKGKDYEKSFRYFVKAGNRAAGLFSNEDAIYFYEKALEQTTYHDPGPVSLNRLHESLGDTYSLAARYVSALEHYSSALKYNTDDSCELSNIYRKTGHVYQNQGQYENAHKYFNLSLDLVENCNEFETALTYSLKSMVLFRENKFQEAEKYSSSALNILVNYDDKYHLAEVYNNLGNICSATDQPDKSYNYFWECIKIRENINDLSGLASVYNNMGNLFRIRNELEQATDSYYKSLELCEKTGNLHGLARVYDNLSNIYTLKGDEEKAMDYNLKAIEIIGRIAKEGSQTNSNIWLQSGVW